MVKQGFSYAFIGFQADGSDPVGGQWSQGSSLDGEGEFNPNEGSAWTETSAGSGKANSGAQMEQL
ncbi:hypothetical protein [Rhizobium laguerreae]|uniref:hypothetical protein n=1 Tax=Rhizobium laguerreae TaxID=1076926 RepID=UPI001FE66AA9